MSRALSTNELETALNTLSIAIDFASKSSGEPFKIARDACIQRFEYCIELCWKISMKKLGSQTKSAKPAVREMARSDLISSAEMWLAFIDARNDTSHSYDEDVAARVFAQIQIFVPEAAKLIDRLKSMP